MQSKWLNLQQIKDDLLNLVPHRQDQIKDLRSALNGLSRVTGRPLTEIPADPEALQKIRATAPWQLHMKKKRWVDIISLVEGLLYDLGVLSMRSRQKTCLLPEWVELFALPKVQPLAHELSRFGRWSAAKE